MKKEHPQQQLLNKIAQTIYDKKGSNILVLDVEGICSLTDYLVIAEGNVDRHVQSIADVLIETLEPLAGLPNHVEGLSNPDWVVLDYTDFIIHLFIPELREKYSLEKLWKAGNIVDVKIAIHADTHHKR